jgi:hypothetical protein
MCLGKLFRGCLKHYTGGFQGFHGSNPQNPSTELAKLIAKHQTSLATSQKP